ncbi:MAG: DUF4091 domain-containing protein [Solobacterium sp.]|nr:DUF4091 domain-containing protein [Solobacterium sp.]
MRKIIGILWMTCLLFLCSLRPVHAKENSFQVYFTWIGNHTYSDTYPSEYVNQGKKEAVAQVWRNDRVLLKAAVFSDIEQEFDITVTPFTNEQGYTLKQDVRTYQLKETIASLGMGMDSSIPHKQVPEIVEETTKIRCNAGNPVYLLLEIPVSSYAYAGEYHGQLTLSSSQEEQSFPITLEVLDLILPQNTLSLDLWQYSYPSYRYYDCLKGDEYLSDKHLEVLRKELELYHNAGGESITVPVIEEPWGHQIYDDTPSLIKWIYTYEGQLTFDYTWFDRYVDLCLDVGIDERIDAFTILPFDRIVRSRTEGGIDYAEYLVPGSDEWTGVWQVFLRDFMSHMKEKGLFDITYIFMDERSYEDLSAAVSLIESVTDENGQCFKIACAINHFPLYDLYDHMQYLTLSIALRDMDDNAVRTFVERRKELGLETTLYNCSVTYPSSYAVSDPAETLWDMYYLKSAGFDGFLRWALNAYPPDPLRTLDNPDFEAGDVLLIYPDEKDSAEPEAMASLRLKLIEQGFRDLTKYDVLKNYDPGMEEVFRSLYCGRGNYNAYGAFLASNDTSRNITMSEVLRIQNSLESTSMSMHEQTLSRKAEHLESLSTLGKKLMTYAWQLQRP